MGVVGVGFDNGDGEDIGVTLSSRIVVGVETIVGAGSTVANSVAGSRWGVPSSPQAPTESASTARKRMTNATLNF